MEATNDRPPTYVEGYHNSEDVSKMQFQPLGNTNLIVSKLALGCSSFGSMFEETANLEDCYSVVEQSIKAGVNFIDVSPWYGNGQAEIVFAQAVKERKIPRKAFYLCTKVGRYEKKIDKMFDFTAKRTIRSFNESLTRLGVEYVDVLLVHDIEFAPSMELLINETLPAINKIKRSGSARYIGVSGYDLDYIKEIIRKSTIQLDCIQCYSQLCLSNTTLEHYLPYFKDHGIGVINAAPLDMRMLTNIDPPLWHPADDQVKEVCKQAARYCQKRGVNISRLALKFSVGRSPVFIATTVISTDNLKLMKENLETMTSSLNEEELEVLESIREKFFIPLNNKGYEGSHVEHYRKELANFQAQVAGQR